MKDHPLADRYPLMGNTELAMLAENIKEHGLIDAITLYQDKILEGRNRFRACKRAGVIPRYSEFKGKSDEEAALFVFAKNHLRRHLTSEERKKDLQDFIAEHPEMSTRTIAKALKVSQTTVAKAKKNSGEYKNSTAGKAKKIIGSDGKKYTARKKRKARPKINLSPPPQQPHSEPIDEDIGNAESYQAAIWIRIEASGTLTKNLSYLASQEIELPRGSIKEIVAAFRAAAANWEKVAQEMERKLNYEKAVA